MLGRGPNRRQRMAPPKHATATDVAGASGGFLGHDLVNPRVR